MKITRRIVFKQCLLVPIALIAILLFSNNTIARDVKKVVDSEEIKPKKELAKEDAKIATMLDLRKFLAKNMRYPVVAQENKLQGKVELFMKINNEGKVTKIVKKSKGHSGLQLDEVVVVSYSPQNDKPVLVDNESKALEKEVKRVFNKLPLIEIPEYKGVTVGVSVKFVLQ